MNQRESSGAPLSHSRSPSGAGRMQDSIYLPLSYNIWRNRVTGDRKVRTNTLRFLRSTFLNPAKGPRGRGLAGVCGDF